MANEPKKRVLLADDDKVSARIVSRGLEKAGFSVTVVADGLAAEQRLANETFDVFVTDWMMPERDGIDVVRRLRARPSGSKSPPFVVVMSVLSIPSARAHAIEAGADGFLAKPFAPSALARLLSAGRTQSKVAIAPVARSHAITRLAAWSALQEATRAVIEETLNAPVSVASGAVEGDAVGYAVACSMTDAEHQLELTVLLTASSSSVGEVGRLMLDDAAMDVGQAAMGDLSDIVAGRMKSHFMGEGYTFHLAIYAEADEAKRAALQSLSVASSSVALVASGSAALSVRFFVRPNGVVEISGEELFEGILLAADLVTDLGALLLPAGTRLTTSAIKRVREHVQRRRIRVCMPRAA